MGDTHAGLSYETILRDIHLGLNLNIANSIDNLQMLARLSYMTIIKDDFQTVKPITANL
jgi:hypothetical protein